MPPDASANLCFEKCYQPSAPLPSHLGHPLEYAQRLQTRALWHLIEIRQANNHVELTQDHQKTAPHPLP